jgi:hypothetical protein
MESNRTRENDEVRESVRHTPLETQHERGCSEREQFLYAPAPNETAVKLRPALFDTLSKRTTGDGPVASFPDAVVACERRTFGTTRACEPTATTTVVEGGKVDGALAPAGGRTEIPWTARKTQRQSGRDRRGHGEAWEVVRGRQTTDKRLSLEALERGRGKGEVSFFHKDNNLPCTATPDIFVRS